MDRITHGELVNASLSQLKDFCERIRKEIMQTVSVRGGHLASNLGVVELTVALHRVFSFPQDKIVFDVGHQCYPHKLLSDRAEKFSGLRTRGGISGFPKRCESEYDCYDTGHAGTAVSAALGMAKARDLRCTYENVIAVVGDGSFNNGLIYEALNSLRILNTRVLIVLNDNGMSISPTVGGTHDILDELKSGKYPEDDVRLFERYGISYMGIVNGNDLDELLPALTEAKKRLSTQSVLLHVATKKGSGYPFSESAPARTHGVSPEKGLGVEYSIALGEELCKLAERDERVVVIGAAMTDALGLRPFFERFPDRAFDVGICEEHACVLSASLAAAGMKPYYAIYSTFLQRAYDEVIHDICGQNLPVTLCVDRAGITGPDGETHQGVFDLSYLSPIPNLTIGIPGNIAELRRMIHLSASYNAPFAIRYPREGKDGTCESFEIGQFEILHSSISSIIVYAAGERCIALAGRVLAEVQKSGCDFTLVNARFLKPLDESLLASRCERYVVTIEDNVLTGGLGDAIARFYRNENKTIRSFGIRDEFLPHGTVSELAEEFGLNEGEIAACILDFYAR